MSEEEEDQYLAEEGKLRYQNNDLSLSMEESHEGSNVRTAIVPMIKSHQITPYKSIASTPNIAAPNKTASHQ